MPRDRCWHPRLRCSKATRSPQIKMTISANQVENWHWCGRTWAEATSSKEGWDIGGTGWLEVQEKPWCAKGGGGEMVIWEPWVCFRLCCCSAMRELGWVTVSPLPHLPSVPVYLHWMLLEDRAFLFFFFLFSFVLHLSVESPEATRGFWGSVRVVRISVFLVKGKQATEMLSDNLHRPVTESFQTSWAASILSWSLLLLSPTGIC